MISELLILSARVCKTGIINKVLLSNYGRNKNQCPSPVIVHKVGKLRVEYFPSELTFLTSLMRIKVILFHLRCFLPLNSFICIKNIRPFVTYVQSCFRRQCIVMANQGCMTWWQSSLVCWLQSMSMQQNSHRRMDWIPTRHWVMPVCICLVILGTLLLHHKGGRC